MAHPKATWRAACFGGVAVLGALTAANIALPLNQSMRDLIAEPESTAVETQKAEAGLAGFDGEEAKLKAAVDAARAQYDKAQDAAKTAFGNSHNLPRDHCRKHRCKADEVTKTAGKAVDGANAAVAAALDTLNNAEKKLRDHSREKVIAALQAAKERHAKAARENWVYGAAATIMQADAAEIPGRDVSRALAIMTGVLSLLGGFLGSFICLASVERLPVPKQPKARNPATMEIVKAAAASIRQEAAAEVVKDVATEFRSASAEAMKPAPSNGNEPKKSPMGEALGAFLKETKLARMPAQKTARKNAAPGASGNGAAAPAKAAKARSTASSAESPPAN